MLVSFDFKALAAKVVPDAIKIRRHLHENPELSFEEKETAAFLAVKVRELGFEPQEGIGGYGIKVVVQGGKGPGRTIAFRSEMDALPLQEETGLPFASKRDGAMHACGHDMHTAISMGTMQAVRDMLPELQGQIVFIFDPAEEIVPSGAKKMVDDGVLKNPDVDALFAMHLLPPLDTGKMAFRAGPLLASFDDFELTVVGKGGHGARPNETVDAVHVAAQIVVALQGVVSRNLNPLLPAVITIGSIHGGTRSNIIAGEVTLQGTIRTLDSGLRKQARERVEEVIRSVCAAWGAEARLNWKIGYPVVVNDAELIAEARAAAIDVLGEENVSEASVAMGADSFAFFTDHVRGAYVRLGSSSPDTPASERYGLHTTRLNPDENAIEVGIAYNLSLIHRLLAS